jgi:hypothetical protein
MNSCAQRVVPSYFKTTGEQSKIWRRQRMRQTTQRNWVFGFKKFMKRPVSEKAWVGQILKNMRQFTTVRFSFY